MEIYDLCMAELHFGRVRAMDGLERINLWGGFEEATTFRRSGFVRTLFNT